MCIASSDNAYYVFSRFLISALLRHLPRTYVSVSAFGAPRLLPPTNVLPLLLWLGNESPILFKSNFTAYRLSRVERSSLRGEFLFLGADVESVEYAKTLNVESAYAKQFDNSGEGVQEAMSYSSAHISKRRRGQ